MDLTSLNTAQREAVEYIDGPSLVIAGAGSGKTRVLTYKIAYLLEQGIKPWNILALTFTNKAANEMKERIGQLTGEYARYLNMGTFHSIFSRILRAEAASVGYTSQFTIYDESDSRSLLKSIIKELNLDDKTYKPATVHNHISMAKNRIELPDDYAHSETYASRDKDSMMSEMPKIYELYQQRLKLSNAMDFDDLLLYTYLLFLEHEDIRQKYCERFQYVLVDEYQDTNSVQQSIILQLVREHHKVCVVGDDAQSIYGFRGANIDNILDFQRKFGTEETPVQLFKLEQNYRSTQTIVSAANSLIHCNTRQIQKNVFSERAIGDPICLKLCYSDREEAILVAKEIKRLRRSEDLSYNSFAILYRTNAQSRIFEEQLRKDTIPYRIFGGLSFYQRKEIKDVIAYFRLVVNPYDEEALRRIINYPTRGIGNTTLNKAIARARELNVPLWDVVSQPAIQGLEVSKAAQKHLVDFATMIKSFASDSVEQSFLPDEGIESTSEHDAYSVGMRIIKESGISKDIFTGTEPDDISRQDNLQELIDSLKEFVDTRREESGDEHITLSDFLQEVSLMTDLDSEDSGDDKVVLMTIHAAKGLEFPVVFIVGLEENIFPSPMCADSIRGIEEERRLLYVAITRAEKYCFLSCAQNRYRYGKMEFDTPSRFLRDIDRRYMQIHDISKQTEEPRFSPPPRRNSFGQQGTFSRTTPGFQQRPVRQAPPAPSPVTTREGRRLVPVGRRPINAPTPPQQTTTSAAFNISVGDRIEHFRFGIGTILSIEGTGENTKAHVEFVNAGTKQLLLKFAKFKKI